MAEVLRAGGKVLANSPKGDMKPTGQTRAEGSERRCFFGVFRARRMASASDARAGLLATTLRRGLRLVLECDAAPLA